ncbi:glycosyltransferase [Lutibacter oricola]|uniref:glycosyltransferase n=1 Tax=Lutibacter oricola TaxID=762486 RepID=UPI001FE1473B|nr:glycosyltransferase [Lutibacter oricola]
MPTIFLSVQKERKLVAKIVQEENILGIISDNRFGVYCSHIPSVYITHQLNVLSGITTFFTSKTHQKIASKYNEVWVPDFNGENNFSGKLSQISSLKGKTKFIGVLSRFQFEKQPQKYNFTVVLSGVEPQRSLLEQKLLNELKNTSKKVLFVRGKLSVEKIETSKNIEVVNFLTSEKLNKVLNQSEIVIARSGYSTIMDLALLKKKAVFIPTPGQNEQEYLAKRMAKKQIAPFFKQEKFTLKQLDKVANYKGFNKDIETKVDLEIFRLFDSK